MQYVSPRWHSFNTWLFHTSSVFVRHLYIRSSTTLHIPFAVYPNYIYQYLMSLFGNGMCCELVLVPPIRYYLISLRKCAENEMSNINMSMRDFDIICKRHCQCCSSEEYLRVCISCVICIASQFTLGRYRELGTCQYIFDNIMDMF